MTHIQIALPSSSRRPSPTYPQDHLDSATLREGHRTAQVLADNDRGSNTAIPYVLRRLILVLLEPQLDVAPDCDRVEGKGPGMICSPCAVGVLKTNRCVSDDLWRRESEQRIGAYLLGFLSVNVEVQSTQLVELRPPPSALNIHSSTYAWWNFGSGRSGSE